MKNETLKELTQAKLADALVELCGEKQYLDVGVADICQRADVSRSTFYRYYTSKDDLLKSIEKKYMQDLNKISEGFFKITYDAYLHNPHIYEKEMQKIWEYHYATKKYCRLFLSSNGDPYFTYLLQSFLERAYRSMLEENGLTFGKDQEVIIKFQVSGILSVLYSFLGQDSVDDKEIYKTMTQLFVNIPFDHFAKRI